MHALIDRCILNVCVRGSFGVCFLLYKGNFQMKLFILKLFKFFSDMQTQSSSDAR